MGETVRQSRARATSPLPYRLGLPAWNFPAWQGRYFAYRPRALRSYAWVFNAVEGNTTFYRTPGARTVAAWREAVHGTDFRFSFKLPREITHASRAPAETLRSFLSSIEPLEEHLGPLLVQFPPWVGPNRLKELGQLFARLPSNQRYVVEVRHPHFFSHPVLLEPLLEKYALGRVVLDARALSGGGRSHPEVLAARHEKPVLPVLPRVYNNVMFLRLVLHPERQHNRPYIEEWSARVADYIVRGCAVYAMIHCPNNLHCPELALEFHRALLTRRGMRGVPALEPWPVPRQGQLF
ncbi:MAG: DUF72 domain-containing protein [Gammaproteobacteria bacterium]|nr:DUF72 domain-containing protein [Gammaproteobacteria bacterium]